MSIIELKERPTIADDIKLSDRYNQFRELLSELKKKELSQQCITVINESIEEINSSSFAGLALKKLIKERQSAILKLIEKEHKITPKNYYRNLWGLFGMSGFGLPIGVAFGLSIDNMGMLGIGLPIGLAIGFAIGLSMDKKALNEGRQLDLEIKY